MPKQNCALVCSGEVGSGKTTLVAKLQGVEEYMKGRGLEYLYISVHDDDIDGISPFLNFNISRYIVVLRLFLTLSILAFVFRPHEV